MARGHPVDELSDRRQPVSVVRNRTVAGVGLASLFSDTGHELATAALPGFLNTLCAPVAALGAIEGVADAALSSSKLLGAWSPTGRGSTGGR